MSFGNAARPHGPHLPPDRAGQEARLRGRARPRRCRARCTPTTSGCSRSSRTCCRTPSSSPKQGGVKLEDRAGDAAAGAPGNESLKAGQVLAFSVDGYRHRHPGEKQRSSSRRSSRPTAPPAASTAAPASACRSAARSPACSAASSTVISTPGEGSTFTLYLPLELRAGGRCAAARARRHAGAVRPAPAPMSADALAAPIERRSTTATRSSCGDRSC